MRSVRADDRNAAIWVFSLTCAGLVGLLSACSSDENSGDGSNTGGSAGAATAGSGTSAGSAGMSAAGMTSTSGGMGTTTGGMATSGAASGGVSTGGAAGTSTGGSGGSSTAGAAGAGTGGSVTSDRSPEGTCTRWKADTANLSEGTWSGNADSCMAGDISADGRENALRMFNLMRWLAALPAVVTEDVRNQQAQACALMMTANKSLSHSPPMDWKCYTELGAKGASTSNISSGPGVSSVLLYMVDGGNETTFGHRRIILSNELGPIGLGSAGKSGSSCMQNIGGKGKAGKEWMAWPPPGPFPMQAYGNSWETLDETGWSIQAKDIDLKSAKVTVTSGGQDRPVTVEQLADGYGGADAIRIVLSGWKAEAGSTYSVSVSGTSKPIAYEIQMIDCK